MRHIFSRWLAASRLARKNAGKNAGMAGWKPALRRLRDPALSVGSIAFAGALLLAVTAAAATRPRYGGALRVEIRESFDAADSPAARRFLGALSPSFTLSEWAPGRRAIYTADENAAGGRPFLDTVEIQMARPTRDQSIDLGLDRADVVELGP